VTETKSNPIEVIERAPIGNSFGISAKAKKTVVLTQVEQLKTIASMASNEKHLVLGGASNVLFTRDFDGLIVRNELKGVQIEQLAGNSHRVTVGAGENWSDLVDTMTARGLYGLENLSLIPGSVGASPIQNIGAYGVEMKQSFTELKAFDLVGGKTQIFTKDDCRLGYRDSIFKLSDMREWLIIKVSFVLSDIAQVELGYGDLKTEALRLASRRGSTKPTPVDVSQAVKNIRRSKLPDPAVLGNAGSFFKNPILDLAKVSMLKAKHPELPTYSILGEPSKLKVSAGWLIDQAGWKAFRRGDAGVHKDHALVLVNYGLASGNEIAQLASDIQISVKTKFGIEIEPEPILV
jgi:UDP-N-acetylmuramate dehydrogenase